MDITVHGHHAEISTYQRERAAQAVRKLERKLGRASAAVVRFHQDGPTRRVEIALSGWRGRRFVAQGAGRFFGSALSEAVRHVSQQIDHVKRAPKTRYRGVKRG